MRVADKDGSSHYDWSIALAASCDPGGSDGSSSCKAVSGDIPHDSCTRRIARLWPRALQLTVSPYTDSFLKSGGLRSDLDEAFLPSGCCHLSSLVLHGKLGLNADERV